MVRTWRGLYWLVNVRNLFSSLGTPWRSPALFEERKRGHYPLHFSSALIFIFVPLSLFFLFFSRFLFSFFFFFLTTFFFLFLLLLFSIVAAQWSYQAPLGLSYWLVAEVWAREFNSVILMPFISFKNRMVPLVADALLWSQSNATNDLYLIYDWPSPPSQHWQNQWP